MPMRNWYRRVTAALVAFCRRLLGVKPKPVDILTFKIATLTPEEEKRLDAAPKGWSFMFPTVDPFRRTNSPLNAKCHGVKGTWIPIEDALRAWHMEPVGPTYDESPRPRAKG